MQNLADERLAGGKIAVGFHPHGPDRLEASLHDTLFHPRIESRNVLFEPVQQLGLALAVMVVGIALHQGQDSGDGMSNLLAGSPIRPHPADIEMGMTTDRDLWAVAARQAISEMRLQIFISSHSRGRETFALPALTQIEHVVTRIEMQ